MLSSCEGNGKPGRKFWCAQPDLWLVFMASVMSCSAGSWTLTTNPEKRTDAYTNYWLVRLL